MAARGNYALTTNYPSSQGGVPSQSGPPYSEQTAHHHGNPSNNQHDSHHQNKPRQHQSQNQPTNRGLTYATNASHNPPPPQQSQFNQKRRVQIIDHNRQTPSTSRTDYASGRQSHDSTNGQSHAHRTPTSEMNQAKPSVSHANYDRTDDNRQSHHQHAGQNSNIHEYLYGLAAPDPGKRTKKQNN